MDIFDLKFDNWHTISLTFNWGLVLAVILIGFVVSFIWKKFLGFSMKKSVEVEEVALGIGSNKITLKFNKKDQEVAYKLWVELNTRKIGLAFEPEYDVIIEVYDSWYKFFGIARNLMKDIPPEKLEEAATLVELTGNVLNEGLRPHLTRWHAKFRKWYDVNKDLDGYKEKTPQEIQRLYPLYDELEKDLLETNYHMIEYKKLLRQIAYKG